MIVHEAAGEPFRTPEEWIYRGEGNSNIVISLPLSKQILRIRKTEKPKSILGWILVLISDFFHWYYGRGFSDEIRDLKFYSKIMRPLIGFQYTSEFKQVVLSRKQMKILEDGLLTKRPEFRLQKTFQYGRAALFNDFAFLPREFDGFRFSENTFSVEIKPKQGWRPFKEQIHPQCIFCMNQYLKLEKKMIKTRTIYCPEELFSGDKHRMKTAIKNLMEVPQNNLRIFKNGLCFSDQSNMLSILREIFELDDSEEILSEEFCDFLQRCLVKSLGNDLNEHLDISWQNNECSFNVHSNLSINNMGIKLPKGCVLERILSVQMLDQEGTHSTYKKLKQCGTWDDYSFVDKLLNIVDNGKACMRCTLLEASRKCENELLFLPYLVSAIAKDCSLMITFRKLKEEVCNDTFVNNIFKTKYGTFLVNIGVFDLYPKPLSTIQKHYKRNREIFKALKKQELSV